MDRVVRAKILQFKFSDALAEIWSAISFGDRYVNERKVWEIKDDVARGAMLFNLVSLLGALASALVPFMPDSARKINDAIVHEGKTIKAKKIDILFPRVK
jgi:methionyl-tRNA synthetase